MDFIIDCLKVIQDASKGDFDYLMESMQTHQKIYFNNDYYIQFGSNSTLLQRINSGNFPYQWNGIDLVEKNEPTLFRYIIQFNRKDVLLQMEENESFKDACTYKSSTVYAYWILLIEALRLQNKEFEIYAWRLMAKYYKNRIEIHPYCFSNINIFTYIIRKIKENDPNLQPFLETIKEKIIQTIQYSSCSFDRKWFDNIEARNFVIQEVKSFNQDLNKPVIRFMQYEHRQQITKAMQTILCLVLNSLPTDLIKFSILPYCI